VDQIPIRSATREICAALGADPLRLIASGALLIACPDGAALVRGLQAQSIEAVEIGGLTASVSRELIHSNGDIEVVEDLPTEELYRLLRQTPSSA
jgi:hydrogenase maturation factor